MIIIKQPVGIMSVNCYILGEPHEAIIIDPGSNHKQICEILKEKQITVKYIVLTHCHFDHIMAVEEVAKTTGAQIVACSGEKQNLLSPDINYTNIYSKKPLEIVADIYVNDGDIIKSGDVVFKIVETPGHTSGGMCLYCAEEKILISGDTLFYSSIGRCDLATGEERVLLNSIKTKLFTLPDDVSVLPGHGENTSIGYEKRNNPFVR